MKTKIIKACSLLVNVLIRVELFLGKVSFDFKVDATSLQSKNKTSAATTTDSGNNYHTCLRAKGLGYGEVFYCVGKRLLA